MRILHSARLLLLAALLPLAGLALDNSDCFDCHNDKSLVKTNAAGQSVSLFVDKGVFTNSIHAKHLCVSCHSDITDLPHPDHFTAKEVSCAQCHRVETDIYKGSDHGQAVHKGTPEAASCKDCHGSNHYLLSSRNPASPVYRTNLPKTCERCHNNVADMEKFKLHQSGPGLSYEKSVHGIALLENGKINAANCADCHGTHDLHRSTNPASKLYWQKVPATCGKCHENVAQTYLRSVHRLPRRAHHCRGKGDKLTGLGRKHPRNLRPVPCIAAHRDAVPAAAKCICHVCGELPRPGAQGRQPHGCQLRLVPRRA